MPRVQQEAAALIFFVFSYQDAILTDALTLLFIIYVPSLIRILSQNHLDASGRELNADGQEVTA